MYFLRKILGLYPKLSTHKKFQFTIRSKWWNRSEPRKVFHELSSLTTEFLENYVINTGRFNKNYMDSLIPLTNLKISDNNFRAGFVFFDQVPNITSKSLSIDGNRTEYFNKHSSEWWSREGSMRVLHNINDLSMEFIKEHLIREQQTTPLKNLNILDIGCGGGIISEPLAKLGCNVTGIDVNPDLIDVAKAHASMDPSLKNLTYTLEGVEDQALKNPEKYDVIILTYVLNHVNHQKDFLNTCIKCLKPGGSLFLSGTSRTMMSWLFAIILGERIFKIIPVGVNDWKKMLKIEEVQNLLEANKCRRESARGLMYNVLNEKWFWIKNTSFYYVLHSIKEH